MERSFFPGGHQFRKPGSRQIYPAGKKPRLRMAAIRLPVTSYSFVIHPPWWQTWWFRSAMFLSIIIILGLIVRGYYQRKLHQQLMALEKQQAVEKERTRIASDMHDDLGSGLSTIRFLSEKVKRKCFQPGKQG